MSAEAWAGLSCVVSALALIVSIKTYIQVQGETKLHLRIKLAAAFSELNVYRREMPGTLEQGNRSRERVINVRNPGGASVAWRTEFEADLALLNAVLERAPADRGSHEKLSVVELEQLIVAVDSSLTELRKLEAKYSGLMAQDDAFRNARIPRVGHSPVIVVRDPP